MSKLRGKLSKSFLEKKMYQANIWKLYLFQFFMSLHFMGGVLVPFYLDWGGISFTQIMILQSVFVFSIFLLEIPTGAVADFFGRKTSIVLGALITAISAFVYTSYPSFYVFLVGEFMWALGFALLSGAHEALVYDSLKKIKKENTSKKIFGKMQSLSLIGLMISAPIGSIIAVKFGLRYAFMAIGIPMFISFIIALTIKEPIVKKINSNKKNNQKRPSYLKTITEGINYFRKHRILKILAFDMISVSTLAFFVIWTYQPLLTTLGIHLIYFGIVHSAITGIQIPVLNGFDKLEKLVRSKKRYLFLSALITGIGMIIMGVSKYVPLTIFAILLVSAFGLSRQTLFNNYLNKYIESHNRATVLSSISMMSKLSRAIAYPIIGLLVEQSLTMTLVILGFALIIVSLISKVEEEHLID
ncbi:MFS transporter [Candidatus Woesearchaeota archaeon]|jgi:MFS family permease|nr:MFS transporter [Candidatus Woesearchaeota archaeon]MBT6519829.1 MFS transporter [Candidatus Woesearchaeota archaeon]MBT7368208.1 MFS transporter [Candidatus Woesearchaeota archaeon]